MPSCDELYSQSVSPINASFLQLLLSGIVTAMQEEWKEPAHPVPWMLGTAQVPRIGRLVLILSTTFWGTTDFTHFTEEEAFPEREQIPC